MSAVLQDRLDAVGRLLELSRASSDDAFREYAAHASAAIVSSLDGAAIARRTNAKIVEEYCTAIGAQSLIRRILRAERGSS